MRHIVERHAAMHGLQIVPHHDVARPPRMAVYVSGLGRMLGQFVQEGAAICFRHFQDVRRVTRQIERSPARAGIHIYEFMPRRGTRGFGVIADIVHTAQLSRIPDGVFRGQTVDPQLRLFR